MESTYFQNTYDRIFTVKLSDYIGQPFVCGTIDRVIKYALNCNHNIEGIYELSNHEFNKLSTYELKEILLPDLAREFTFNDAVESIKNKYGTVNDDTLKIIKSLFGK